MWNSRITLSIYAFLTGGGVLYAVVGVLGLPVIREHSSTSIGLIVVGLMMTVFGWVRIFSRKRGNGRAVSGQDTAT